ncbi:AfsR/SARP family transcriptional regulator [Streptomyces sp. AJS327]|uniref:AfsR/SARP family transcriptional regulator n=1 Tax=Streptomyces sp. AJS327 TaxID=2545265 RepID=UPI0015DFA368|nr:AfsR/SARP family transcriptional regulator [Streptomyces sp. AJS327]MBA0053170.1 AfsR/SARP family transcriptional regulator [Streptomyces sp. AJS327]
MKEPTFGVLGPLQVRAGGALVPVGGPKPRAVLATLLLQPGGFVSLDLLTEVLWPGGAPRSAVANVRTYVRNLRRALVTARVPGELRTERSGYALDVEPAALDRLLFEQRLEWARDALERGDYPEALRGYEAALALWRGGVLQDVPPSVVWDPTVTRIEALRSAAVDECLQTRMRMGDYPTLVSELRSRLAEDPLREDLWRMLTRALHDAGRGAEARAAYQDAERVLAAELGVEPSAPLRAVGEEVRGYAPARRVEQPTPVCQLPMDIPDFTGRATETGTLERLLALAGRQPVAVIVSGAPGSGKSTLAVRVAHRVRETFPDGQLHVDLGAMGDRPREPGEVLAEMLRGLGVIDSAIPSDVRERAALFRSRLAQRRFLIVLDDAVGADQVRPLLPGTGGCAVLVTSRRRMPELPAYHLPLEVMSREDAGALFAAIVGPERLRAHAGDVDRVVAGCGSLPLAVRIAGARLANRPGWTVGALADYLHDERGRLDQLRTGGLAVRASAELSYRHLPADAALAFRCFGQLAEEDVPAWMVGVAMGRPGAAPDAVETLLDEHLLEVAGTDGLGTHRYRMHHLLRCYARELAEAGGPGAPAGARLADVLIGLARVANAATPVRFLGVLGEQRPLDAEFASLAEVPRARPVDWFEGERRVLVAAVDTALARNDVPRAADLAIELAGFFDMRGYYGDWLSTHRRVLEAVPEPYGVRAAALLRNLGQLHLYQDRYAEALADFARSRELFAGQGHRAGEAVAALGVGSVYRVTGELDAARATFESALRVFVETGDPHGEAVARNGVASVWLERGDAERAAGWLDGALRLARDVGDRHREAQVRRRIAVAHELRGDPAAARAELERALSIFDELSDTHCAAYVQQSVGELCLRQGNEAEASALLVGALAVQRQLGDRRAEARVAGLLGELHHRTGRKTAAQRYYHRSLSAWRRLEAPEQAELVDAKLRALR